MKSSNELFKKFSTYKVDFDAIFFDLSRISSANNISHVQYDADDEDIKIDVWTIFN